MSIPTTAVDVSLWTAKKAIVGVAIAGVAPGHLHLTSDDERYSAVGFFRPHTRSGEL